MKLKLEKKQGCKNLLELYGMHCILKKENKEYDWSFLNLYIQINILQRFDIVYIKYNKVISVILLIYKNSLKERIEVKFMKLPNESFNVVHVLTALRIKLNAFSINYRECIIYIDEYNKNLINSLINDMDFNISIEDSLIRDLRKVSQNKKILKKCLTI